MKKYLLEIIVFITGMGVMVFELIASRVLAPYVGTTIIIWSSLIGIILAALSVGYWWGGRLADRRAEYHHFALLIFFAAISIGLSGILKNPILNFLDAKLNSFRWEAVWATLILFAPGSFFLASISPYAVRLKLDKVEKSGTTVGNLYAISTAGSILGAFLTGWILVIYLGNTKIIFALAVILFLASILSFRERFLNAKIAGVVIVIILFVFGNNIDNLFFSNDTTMIRSQYSDIFLKESTDTYSDINTASGTGRPILTMYTSPAVIQSAMFLDNDTELVFPYTKFFKNLSSYFNPNIQKALLIGGAAYSYPKDYLASNTGTMDVVEIDPMMTAVAKQYFNTPDDPRLTTYNMDGRVFLNQNNNKYDAIYVDAFHSFAPPFQLMTEEAVQKMYDSLNDNGVIFLNMVSSISGDHGKFLRSEYSTYKKVFPQVYVFRVQVPFPDVSQNLVMVASKSNVPISLSSTDKLTSDYLEHVWTGDIAMDMPVVTDDYAPVADLMLATSKTIK